jgi:hypothetical protein
MGARTRGIANQILSGGLDATDGLSGAVSSSNITNASVTSVHLHHQLVEVLIKWQVTHHLQ